MTGLVRTIAANVIARNSFFLGLSGACRGLAEVSLIILAIRTLGPSMGGQVIIGFSIIRIAQYFTEGGLGMYLTREIPRNPDLTGTYTLEALKLVAMAAPIGFLIALAAAAVQPELGLAIGLGTAAVIFGAAQPILGAAFLAHGRTHWVFISMMTMAITLVAGGLLGATLMPSLLTFFLVIAVSRAAGFGVALFAFLGRLRPTITLGALSARRALAHGFPYSLNMIGTFLYLRVDILLLGAIAGSMATGIYGSVADPLVSLTSFVYIISFAFLPTLSKAYGKEPSRFARLLQRMLLLNLSFGAIVAAAVFLGADRFVSLAFGDELAPAAGVLRVLSAAILLRFLNSGLATWLTASGRQWHRTSATLGAAAFNITLNLITIPIWGYWAAAWTTVGTEAVLLTLFLWFLRPEIAIGLTGRIQAYGLPVHDGTNVNPD